MTFIDGYRGFRATGKGLANKQPGKTPFVATKHNANGLLENKSPELPEGHPFKQLWLFVTGLQTGWKVAGAHSQTQRSRTFQPQHLMQDELVVLGITPSQYEYDRIVEFVARHHEHALASTNLSGFETTTGDGGSPISFRIVPYLPANPTSIQSRAHGNTPPIHVEGYITGIAAGAERFQNAKPFELRIKVTNDFLQQPWENARIGGVLFQRYLAGFAGSGKDPWYTEEDVVDPGDQLPTLGNLIEGAFDSTLAIFLDGEGTFGEDLDAGWQNIKDYGSGVANLFRSGD